jgi:type II secretory pathway component PulM
MQEHNMAGIAVAIGGFIKDHRWAQFALLAVAVMIIWAVFRLVWLPNHDRAVRAEYLVELKEQSRRDSERAAREADKAAAAGKEKTDDVQNRIANSSSVDGLFDRLREAERP